jgi:hypothetical protein
MIGGSPLQPAECANTEKRAPRPACERTAMLVAKQLHCPPHHQQPDAEAIGASNPPSKNLENLCLIPGRYAHPFIVHVDSHVLFEAPAAD